MERKEKQTKFLGGITGKLLLATLVLMQSQTLSGYNRADFGCLIDWAGSNSILRRFNVFPEGYVGDLSGANLSNLNLSQAQLCGVNLSGANLSGAKLSGADLSGADLSDANLQAADLFLTKFCGANLSGANVTGTRSFPLKPKRIRSLNIFNAQGFSQVGRQQLLDNGAIEEAPPEEEPARNADAFELRRLREQLGRMTIDERDDALELRRLREQIVYVQRERDDALTAAVATCPICEASANLEPLDVAERKTWIHLKCCGRLLHKKCLLDRNGETQCPYCQVLAQPNSFA